ncbi:MULTISPECIES: hypothetical protein [unclassified Bradyrhizobium]|uniref:hypothetical protein n=1 Tax=unclassified Bradyrhizobium TaxID=2631580 RepID=UPI0012E3F996|nr:MULTISPECIES: hypothetical protein [unclassified Bradyrhizobium]
MNRRTSRPGWPERRPHRSLQSDRGELGPIDPGASLFYQNVDFRWTFWGYAERLVDAQGDNNSTWRRFRQGSEFDLPRITDQLRPALVYEIDMVNSYFFKNGIGGTSGFGRCNLENFFVAIQDVRDPGHLRALLGQNPHILSREDNLSSGNLPTINRSLILEEHGTANLFGAQFGSSMFRRCRRNTRSPLPPSITAARSTSTALDTRSAIRSRQSSLRRHSRIGKADRN